MIFKDEFPSSSMSGPGRDEDGGGAKAEHLRVRATKAASKHGRLMSSARDGRVLSALMLPFFTARPPSGYGVLTTTGRRTGKTRRKCIRVVRRGNKAYLVSLRLPGQAMRRPSAVAAWVWNIRSEPSVRLRIRGGTFTGIARELREPTELEQARQALSETVNLFDYAGCRRARRSRSCTATGSTPGSRW
jgi:deazaflavin-dependent oxidoreductase (nitroreductase family)